MDCDQVMRMVDAHLDGELSLAESERLLEHIHACAECSELHVAMIEAVDALATLPAPQAPDSLLSDVMAALPVSIERAEHEHIAPLAWGLGLAGALATMLVVWLVTVLSAAVPGSTIVEWVAVKSVLSVLGALAFGLGEMGGAVACGLGVNLILLAVAAWAVVSWRKRTTATPMLMAL